jgi:hypothetical protein
MLVGAGRCAIIRLKTENARENNIEHPHSRSDEVFRADFKQ